MLCARYVRVRLLGSVEWTPKCGRMLLCFYTQYFNLFVLLLTKLHHRTLFYPTHNRLWAQVCENWVGNSVCVCVCVCVCEIVNVKVIVPVNAL